MDPSKPLSAILAKERVAQDHKALVSEAGLIYTLMEKTEKARCWREGERERKREGGSVGGRERGRERGKEGKEGMEREKGGWQECEKGGEVKEESSA